MKKRFQSIVIWVCMIWSTGVYSATESLPEHVGLSSGLRHVLNERLVRNDETPVTVIFESLSGEELGAFFNNEKLNLRYKAGRRYELSVSPKKIKNILNRIPHNVWIRESYPHVPVATSQGVSISGADDFHQLSHTGAGVRIGVIDLKFSDYITSQANGELPVNLVAIDYTGTGLAGGAHGTNVAEIVHDMAPGAELYLAKIGSDTQLSQAVNDMILAGVQIIVHSVAWFGSSFYDGSGALCDTTSMAQDNGILWLNAAGNHRNKHYLAIMTDVDGDSRHEFVSGQNFNTLTVTAGQAINLVLNWDAYPVTKTVDYDLFLYDRLPADGVNPIATSNNRQYSTRKIDQGGVPIETINYVAPVTGTYYIVIEKYNADIPAYPLTLFSLNHDLSVKTLATSIVQPADCSSTIAVAATNLANGAESFSSEGPRWRENGVLKPEISAPDRVVTSLVTSFVGTSAAAPHVGGLAALLFQANPMATVSDIRQMLVASARDVNTAGFDYRTGYGRISVDADLDNVIADFDNCPLVSNSTQVDFDGDGLGDVCDQCPAIRSDDVSDNDSDGLTAMEECPLGTDPDLADSDGDGLLDGEEVSLHLTNPLLADTDTDGFSDYMEVQVGTDPTLASSMPVAGNGDLTGDGVVDIRDMLLGQQVLIGSKSLDMSQLLRGDVAPLVAGSPSPNGVFDLADQLIITRKALGLIEF